MAGGRSLRSDLASRWRAARLVVALWLLLTGTPALAQRGLVAGDPPLAAGALAAFEEAVAAADAAVASPPPWSPDASAWRLALQTSRAAVDAAPGHPATLRLLLRVYASVGWWVRAVDAAEALADAVEAIEPGSLDPWRDGERPVPDGPSTRELVAASFAELAYSRYQAGALEGALEVYERWLAWSPDDPVALRWVGRVWMDLGEPGEALPYWQRLAELVPDDAAAHYFVVGARLGVEVGAEASSAFRRGLERYEAGDLDGAAADFEVARAAAPDFAEAHLWAGRVALEQDRPADALQRYRAAAALRPDDGGIAYFESLALKQVEVGVVAGRAYFEGLAAYQRGELATAVEAFERAVVARGNFAEAWAWMGRVQQEQGRFVAAERAWARVVALDPSDERARGFLNLAREQRAYQDEAGGGSSAVAVDFAAGVAAFERADFVEAASRFARVVAADPESALGWTWLGRVAYTVRDFATAAEAFERSLALRPDDDVAWFAEDAAARLGEQDTAP